MIEDDITPIRSGYEGIESLPVTLSTISLSLDQIKEIKSKLEVVRFLAIICLTAYNLDRKKMCVRAHTHYKNQKLI
jgi:hypothetical protein